MKRPFLERTVLIAAPRAMVFAYFTDSERFAAWWGAGSTIQGRPGGQVRIVYPNGAVALGEVVSVEPERRVVFTYGYEDPSKPIASGGSEVTIVLEDHPVGTWLHLRHELDDAAVRDQHVPGWRYQLAVFANVAAREAHAELDARCDRYFELWGEDDAGRRVELAERLVTPDVRFRDAFACVEGRDDLIAHLTALRMHRPMPALLRDGPARQCQGTAVVDWRTHDEQGQVAMRGSNVIELAPDGRFRSICGLWSPGAQA